MGSLVGKRRKGREIVLQSFYASLISGAPLDRCLDDQLTRRESADETADFARQLAGKIGKRRTQVETRLKELVHNWDPERLGVLEKTILILALTELEHSPDVPWRVVINEACELARRYCDEDAVSFVNGVLDRAAQAVRDDVPDASGEAGP